MSPRPLTSRPLDLLYMVFFLVIIYLFVDPSHSLNEPRQIHIPNTFLVDVQALYPTHIVPKVISQLPRLYVDFSGDPLIGGAMGYPGFGGRDQFAWFHSFLTLELSVSFLSTCFVLVLIRSIASSKSQSLFWAFVVFGKARRLITSFSLFRLTCV